MKTEFPIIKTDRFLLRQFEESDLQNVFNGLSNPDVIKYYGISYDNLEAAKEQISWFAELEDNGTGIWWAICSPDNNIFYGAGGFNNLIEKYRKAEVGFWLLPEFWSQGIMSEVMPVICNYGFNKLNLHRIEAYVETENTSCIKVINKLGFRQEGVMVDCEIKNGKFVSLQIYAIFE